MSRMGDSSQERFRTALAAFESGRLLQRRSLLQACAEGDDSDYGARAGRSWPPWRSPRETWTVWSTWRGRPGAGHGRGPGGGHGGAGRCAARTGRRRGRGPCVRRVDACRGAVRIGEMLAKRFPTRRATISWARRRPAAWATPPRAETRRQGRPQVVRESAQGGGETVTGDVRQRHRPGDRRSVVLAAGDRGPRPYPRSDGGVGVLAGDGHRARTGQSGTPLRTLGAPAAPGHAGPGRGGGRGHAGQAILPWFGRDRAGKKGRPRDRGGRGAGTCVRRVSASGSAPRPGPHPRTWRPGCGGRGTGPG